jgi:hypothetical protein
MTVARTDITRWLTEYDTELCPGYWHFPFTTLDGVEPAVDLGASHGRHSVSFTDPASSSRRVTMGPMLPGPHAEASGKSSVMAANPEHGTWGEIHRNEAAGAEIHAKFGDELVIFGFVYRIDRAPNRNIKLVLVDDSEGADADEMRAVHAITRSPAPVAFHGLTGTAAAWAIVLAARERRQAREAAAG